MAHQPYFVHNTLSALNAVSDDLTVIGLHDISIKKSVDWSGTATLQVLYPGATTWNDVQSWVDTSVETTGEVGSNQNIRVKVTAYSAGSIEVRIRCAQS